MSQILAVSTPPVNGHTARRLQTRSRLLSAGTALFAEHGVRQVTTTQIARHAGVATGTFYLHFEDKHALFAELVRDAVTKMGAALDLDRLDQSDQAKRARDLDQMMAVAEERLDLIRAVFDKGETSNIAEDIHAGLANGIQRRYRSLFANRGITLDPAAAAEARASMLIRLVGWWSADPSPTRRRHVVDALVQLDPLRVAT